MCVIYVLDSLQSEIIQAQPHPFPLPSSCHLPNSSLPVGLYNHGLCPRTPCHTLSGPCSRTHGCCLDDWEKKNLTLRCTGHVRTMNVTIVTKCRCMPCDKVHTIVRGQVLSSFEGKPVILAAVLYHDEVTTLTDAEGQFVFEIFTSLKDTTTSILFHEANHQPLQVHIPITSNNNNINVWMEHVAMVTEVTNLNRSHIVRLIGSGSQLQAVLNIPSCAFILPPMSTVYSDAGCILHSLYEGLPDFTSSALREPIYRDSHGAEFAIFSLILGTLSVLSEHGIRLTLQPGVSLTLSISLTTEMLLEMKEVEKLHLFTFYDQKNRWVDRGKIVLRKTSNGIPLVRGWYTTIIDSKLKSLHPLWAIAQPTRVSCYIRVNITKPNTRGQPHHVRVYMNQTSHSLGHPTVHSQLFSVAPGNVICLRAVCKLGGSIQILNHHGHPYVPYLARVDHALLFGGKGRLMFFCNSKEDITSFSSTPFYPSYDGCINATFSNKGQFIFNPPPPSTHPPPPPPFLSPHSMTSLRHHHSHYRECYIKVGVLACALETTIDVRVSSRSRLDKGLMISDTVSLPTGQDECQEDMILHPLATCIRYPCGHTLTVSAHNPSLDNSPTICLPWTFATTLSQVSRTNPQSFVVKVTVAMVTLSDIILYFRMTHHFIIR